MNWETATALRWTEILVSLAVGLQTLELLWLQLRTPLAEIWNWPDLTVEMRMPKIISSISTALYSRVGFSILLSLQFIIALFLTVAPSHQAPWMLLATAVLVNGRWRGTFNGGSDSMTFVVLLELVFPIWERATTSPPMALLTSEFRSFFLTLWRVVRKSKIQIGGREKNFSAIYCFQITKRHRS